MAYKNKEEYKRYQREHYLRNKQEYIDRSSKYQKKHRARINLLSIRRYHKYRLEVLLHYGKGKLACVKCGFKDPVPCL